MSAATRTLLLPYGTHPLPLTVPTDAHVAQARIPPCTGAWPDLMAAALERPIESPRLEDLQPSAGRILVVVSDATRHEPRREMLTALWPRLAAGADVRIAIAAGTHAPGDPRALDIDDLLSQASELILHDSRATDQLVSLGTTARGTPVIVHRALLEADLVIATGRIKPHYFAGYGAGAKALFPGLGAEGAVRINHRLKADPRSCAGAVDDNPCRLDLEEAARLVPRPTFLLNAITDPEDGPRGAVAGELCAAFRAGAALCGELSTVQAPRAELVIVSDRLPVTASLYQASKLVAGAAGLVRPGGRLIVCAQCPEGTGPLATVNQGIFELGIRHRLAPGVQVFLHSDLPRAEVERTYCRPSPPLQELVSQHRGSLTVIPRAGELILRATPD